MKKIKFENAGYFEYLVSLNKCATDTDIQVEYFIRTLAALSGCPKGKILLKKLSELPIAGEMEIDDNIKNIITDIVDFTPTKDEYCNRCRMDFKKTYEEAHPDVKVV